MYVRDIKYRVYALTLSIHYLIYLSIILLRSIFILIYISPEKPIRAVSTLEAIRDSDN